MYSIYVNFIFLYNILFVYMFIKSFVVYFLDYCQIIFLFGVKYIMLDVFILSWVLWIFMDIKLGIK